MKNVLSVILFGLIIFACGEKKTEQVEFYPKETTENLENPILVKVKSILDKGKNVVIIFMTQEDVEKQINDPENDVYAVWEALLNNFNNASSKNTAFLKLSKFEGGELLNLADFPDNEFSMLFMKKGKKALYYSEPILDSYIYDYVNAYFNDTEKELTLEKLLGTKFQNDSTDTEQQELSEFLGFQLLEIK
ncbi:hypothetical protein IT568_11260 [bacterium]|nr:hypothetical protein [bacterium]